MLKEFRQKYKKLKKSSKRIWASEHWSLYRFVIFITSYKGQKRIWNFIWKVIGYFFRTIFGIKRSAQRDYIKWMKMYFPDKSKLEDYRREQALWPYRPKISIILPVYNISERFLASAINSVLAQAYENWELCISDDNSTAEHVKTVLKKFSGTDKRIKVIFREQNGHISANSNSALSLAGGEFVCLLDHDDKLSPDALYQNVKLLNEYPDLDLIYSDEDKIDEKDQHLEPHFKPDWCPESFLSRNYLGHLVVIRKELIEKIGGFREGFEGSQDFDLLLRVTELTDKIHHIPLVLYHWRMHDESTAQNDEAKPYAFNAGVKALEEALTRRNISASVQLIDNTPGFYSIRYKILKEEKVSIIIPSRNRASLCEVIIASVFKLTTYSDFEIILVDNNSDEDSFFEMVKKWESEEPNRFKCVKDRGSFNFSRLMNLGASHAQGEYLLLLNNDMEILIPEWMTMMVEQCQFPAIGAVGAKLLYQNDTIQHAGVIIGLGGIAGHTFVGYDRDATGYYNFLKCTSNYSAVTAACLMVKKSDYNKVNGFDEALAVEFNDVDFCLKLLDIGLRNVYLPHVELYHYESISRGHPHKTKKSFQQHLHDVKLFKARWQSYIDHDSCYSQHLTMIFTDFRLRVND